MKAVKRGVLRQYTHLPVYIEEDHNEVVPHLHRAIASRHLPMTGVPMVHFDSHPDLLLPLHMQADHVFDKEKLYSELSIENWILPLVYAGHISRVYWLKPPWSDQISDTSERHFSVGKHKETGEIRISLDDPYFLTEALYAPECQLTDVKQVTLHVITVTPSEWRTDTSCFKDQVTSLAASHPVGDDCVKDITDEENAHSSSDAESTHGPETASSENGEQFRARCTTAAETQTKCSATGDEDLCPPTPKVHKTDKCEEGLSGCVQSLDPVDGKSRPPPPTLGRESVVNGKHRSPDRSWLLELKQQLEGHPYILDIDLDFFSTKDPFQNDCTPEQTTLLQQLFEFQLPDQKTERGLLAFSQARQAQLDELLDAFLQLQQQPESVPSVHSPHRQKVLEKFLKLLPQAGPDQPPVDFEMLYRAGCTFDGTALPHHVSSPRQIGQLMDATAQVLRSLPSPTIITVSRSSVDDYCPQDQVEMIQDKMMEVLTAVYKDIDVQKLYEQQQ